MADYDSSLPVRTESAGDIDVFISDATVSTQKLKVNADGSIDTNFAAGSKVIITDGTDDLEINADGSVNVKQDKLVFATDTVDISGSDITATVSSTDLDIRDLVFSTDKVDVSGSSVTVSSTDLDIRDLAFATDSIDVSGSDITAVVSATDLDIRDLNASIDSIEAYLKDGSGADYTALNPLPVEFFENQTESFDYNQSVAIAANASSTHTYAAPAGFKLKESFISASGKIKAELKINSVTVAVGFNSTANPNISFRFEKGLNASGVNIEIIKTNLDKQSQDLYSTIVGIS